MHLDMQYCNTAWLGALSQAFGAADPRVRGGQKQQRPTLALSLMGSKATVVGAESPSGCFCKLFSLVFVGVLTGQYDFGYITGPRF